MARDYVCPYCHHGAVAGEEHNCSEMGPIIFGETIPSSVSYIDNASADEFFAHPTAALLKNRIAELSQDERQELYKYLHDAYGCRIY